ncbi:HNH endonuclease signature motif containing protein [Mycolicibacterium insubricum]|uniref:HNH endonuclease signature motif containing protein n=1 Tax=Mycolicibacterium insubricum TaxID=444597 RepID=UPI0013D468B2|nr:HNH endonuclease signature motif containing protein [Mycolicibacterium insubricum]MCV7080493.1 DUF222 domain-containing protein [Mycolicibacterium insubricum]
MSSNEGLPTPEEPPGNPKDERLRVLFAQLGELCGQRNALDGQIVDIVAEIDHDGLWGSTGARSVAGLVAWKTGSTTANAVAITAIAHRVDEFPQCTRALRDGQLSLDQVGVIAAHAGKGSDAHYAQLASVATVAQLRTAVRLEPRPDTGPKPGPAPGISKIGGDDVDTWRIRLPHIESAKFAAALASHRDALLAQWSHDHPGHDPHDHEGHRHRTPAHGEHDGDRPPALPDSHAPVPTTLDAFLRLIQNSWDAESTARPHGQHTTVVVHLDADAKIANLHLGPLLSDADRQYLTCEATCEVWFHRDGTLIGAGHRTRTVNRRLRRALEHRDRTCVVPGCGATRGLHAHHLIHWESGGPTELWNLVLVCPYHHRLHHKGVITITGPADRLKVTDADGEELLPGSLAHPPQNPPPAVAHYPGPTGERANWWWYNPFQPQPPPAA